MDKRENPANGALKRCFGLRECLTLTTGTVIGVGLFTVGANAVGVLGTRVLWATLAALAVSIYPALLYAEMGAALPFSGGTYQYAALGLGRAWGMLAGWNFIISMVSVAGGEALAFAFYLRTLCGALGFALPVSDTALALLALLLFIALAACGVRLTGRMQNAFLFFFWGVAAVWVLSMLGRLDVSLFAAGGGAASASGGADFWGCVAMVWWCFAGFETCCALGEEIRHPQINLPRALLLAPFLVFAVNALFQWMLLCIVPASGLSALAQAAAPYAEGMRMAGVVGLPLVLLCAGIAFGGDFSTLNAGVSAPARYLYTMARDGVLPGVFARLSPRTGAPIPAILALGGLMVALVCTGSIVYIASLSLFATLLCYILGIASACGLRRRQPRLARPFKAPLLAVGAPVSALIYLWMIFSLERAALISGSLWCLLGLAVYGFYARHGSGALSAEPPLPELPDPQERARLDREFRRWRAAVVLAVLAVLALYGASYLLAR